MNAIDKKESGSDSEKRLRAAAQILARGAIRVAAKAAAATGAKDAEATTNVKA